MTTGLSYPKWALAPMALALTLLGLPLVGLLVRADWARLPELLMSERSLDALRLSLYTCLISTFFVLILGVPTALVLARTRGRWASAARTLVTVPMVLPPVVAGLALLTTLGRRGLVGQHLSALGIEIGFTTTAVVIAQTFVALPFLVVSLEGALRSSGQDYERAATYLGASPTRTLLTVTLPMAAPALASGTALSFAPPHLSVYHLTIEPNTYFAKFPPVVPDEDTAYDMLDRITELTGAAGMKRYEISAYARANHECWHNTNYWQFGDYLGIGAGAHSKLSFAHRVVRQVRLRDPNRYMEGALAGLAVAQDDDVRRADLPFEYMLNALRLRDGFSLQDYMDRTGTPLSTIDAGLKEAEAKGLITRSGLKIQPTERGFDFLSDLQSLFLAP